MPVITIGDVLDHAEQFEEALADYYRDVSDKTTREGVKILADYMSRHRRHLTEGLAELPVAERARLNTTNLRYEPQAADCRCFNGVDLAPDATAQEVLDAAVLFDECLIRLYRQVLQQDVDQKVKDLFAGLVGREEQDEIQLKKIKAMDYF